MKPVDTWNFGEQSTSFMCDSFHGSAPPLHEGYLYKKSPNPLRIWKFQQRYIELALGHLSWSASKGSANKGRIDFSKNQCEVAKINETGGDLFEVRPLGGSWAEGDFTGSEWGRSLIFDAKDSEHSRDEWIHTIHLHINYGMKYGLQQASQALGDSFAISQPIESIAYLADEDDLNKLAYMANGNGMSNGWPSTPSSPSGGKHDSLRLQLDSISYEDANGTYPLKAQWDMRVPKPPIPDRSSWRGVFNGAPTEIVEELSGSARYRHAALPLDHRSGEPDPSAAPNGAEDGALRHVMEFINYHIVLQGRPRCFYAGVGKPSPEMRNMQDTQCGLFAGHFECQACFACPHGGNGGVTDLIRNCWNTQAMLNHGGFQWMSMTAGHNGKAFVPFTTPFGLRAVPMPSRAKRAELLNDPEFIKDRTDMTALASSLYVSGHGPYLVVYQRPQEHNKEQADDPCWAWEHAQDQVNQVAPGNTSRVLVYPPPGIIVKGGFQGERIGGRKGMPGEQAMAEEAGVNPGSTLGGPAIKVHFFAISDHAKYRGCRDAKLVDLETGEEVPCWVSDSMAKPGEECYKKDLNDYMDLSAGKVWMIPKSILTMNQAYQCSMKLLMEDGPIDLLWSWTTFGPRVYDIPGPNPEDTTKSLDWALETISDMKMKPRFRSDGTVVPSVICLRPGVYHVHARFIDPGGWLHIEGSGIEETTLVIEAPMTCETFSFPPQCGPNGLRGQKKGYEFGWQNPTVPLFNMARNCSRAAEHSGWKQPSHVVTISGLTLRHNIPLVLGDHGSLELVDCHVIGPSSQGLPMLGNGSGGPMVRLSEVTHLPAGLFKAADLDSDGRLSPSEFKALAEHDASLSVEDLDEVFEAADADEDGFLSQSEFEAAYLLLVCPKDSDSATEGEEPIVTEEEREAYAQASQTRSGFQAAGNVQLGHASRDPSTYTGIARSPLCRQNCKSREDEQF